MFKGASASVKTEQLTSQAPCSYITRSIFLPHSFCLYFFSPPLSTSISSISSSLPRVLVPLLFCFGLKKKLGQAFYRTSLFAFIPTLSLKIAWLCFFFLSCQIFVGLEKNKLNGPYSCLTSLLIQLVFSLLFAFTGKEKENSPDK